MGHATSEVQKIGNKYCISRVFAQSAGGGSIILDSRGDIDEGN